MKSMSDFYVTMENYFIQIITVDVKNDKKEVLLTEFRLYQNYPNPFNPSTIISYQLPKQGFVSINIYNILGQKITSLVKNPQSAGSYQFNFDASNLSAGTYIYQLKAGDFIQKKMLLLK